MEQLKPFIIWWIVFLTSVVCFIIAGEFGLFEQLWELDQSKISFLILPLYWLASALCGWTAWHTTGKNANKQLRIGWFSSDLFVRLGLIGTVIGFIIAFADLIVPGSAFSFEAAKGMIQIVGSGLAVAFLTTLVGLACSVLIRIQLVVVELFMDE